jgi:hypothetical protein
LASTTRLKGLGLAGWGGLIDSTPGIPVISRRDSLPGLPVDRLYRHGYGIGPAADSSPPTSSPADPPIVDPRLRLTA